MVNYKKELEIQLKELDSLLAKVSKNQKGYKGLEPGKLRVTSSHGIPQYRFVKDGSSCAQYLPAIEKEKIAMFAQREYDETLKAQLIQMKKRLNRFLKTYDPGSISDLYSNMCEGRKKLVTPVTPTDEMLIDIWMATYKGCLNPYEEAPYIKTNRGECVRSKSEKILADYFYIKGIPYQFEPMFKQLSGKIVYPDFALLNLRKRKTYYWEHLGKVDEKDYASRNFEKLMDYEESGLIIGQNLIVTMETRERPLDIKLVEKKVHQFLL